MAALMSHGGTLDRDTQVKKKTTTKSVIINKTQNSLGEPMYGTEELSKS